MQFQEIAVIASKDRVKLGGTKSEMTRIRRTQQAKATWDGYFVAGPLEQLYQMWVRTVLIEVQVHQPGSYVFGA
jgi:hypothetical protein